MATAAQASPLHPNRISDGYVVFLGLAGMMTFLSTICVALRFISLRLTLFLYSDDFAALGALLFAYGCPITTALVATLGGAGYHITTYSLLQLKTYLQASRFTGHISRPFKVSAN